MPRSLLSLLVLLACTLSVTANARERWSIAAANHWYEAQPWYVGSNYIPANAINQLEMWQAETFDPVTIEKELGWAEGIGMNAMRVFLHNLLWEQDPAGFKRRINQFLEIADRHHIKIMFVLFDSVWNPNPRLGPQHPPIPGVHNSGWVQAPGRDRLADESRYGELEDYVRGVVGAFAHDKRILVWDIWNEPDHPMGGADRQEHIKTLLAASFKWARSANPDQPLTSAVHWHDHEWTHATLSAMDRVQIENSDINSFHDYQWPEEFERRAKQMQAFGRPVLCTEYLGRSQGSTIDGSLPIAKKLNIGMFNWGLVDGKTQTRFPGDSWNRPYTTSEPGVWFHDIFRADGTPYRAREAEIIKKLTAAPKGVVP